MRCPACDHENPDSALFCMACAAPFARRCKACGTATPAGAKFCPECAVPLAAPAAAAEPASEPAERRQLTVLFCDLVGSTELSGRLDPEEWQGVLRRYQESAAAVLEPFGGHVAQLLGDGLLVYFGYPHAHDDDAERAVRAGLGLVEALRELTDLPVPLAVRIGIHTGPVVVGQLGGGVHRETLALGETTNLAARLQGVAAPDTAGHPPLAMSPELKRSKTLELLTASTLALGEVQPLVLLAEDLH